jgi:uncharacterized protein
MNLILLIIAFICLLVGLAGAILPLPGPPLSYVGILILHYTHYNSFSDSVLWGLGFATALITVLDYYVPIWGIKKFGGTKGGMWGSTIGVVVGCFFIPAIGIFVGAFAGAFIGELIAGSDTPKALKAAIGSFVGFITGIFMKTALCLVMIGYAVVFVWSSFGM